MKKKINLALLFAVLTTPFTCNLALAADASKAGKVIPVTLQLQWLANDPQFAGYYAAKYLDYYKEEGLEVNFKPGGPQIESHKILSDGGADFAISWLPKVLANPQTNASLVNIAQVFQRGATMQISWKDSGITKPEDWRGKKVGTWGGGDEYELYAAMRKVGIDPYNKKDVTIVHQSADMSLFLNRQIDAAQAMSYNEYGQVLSTINPVTGKLYQPSDLTVIDFDDPKIGTGMLEDGIYVRKDWIARAKNQETAIKFLRASFKGWIYCRDNFEECKNIMLNISLHPNEKHITWALNEVNDLIWPSPKNIGVMDPQAFLKTVKIMHDNKLINHNPDKNFYRTDLAQKALDSMGKTDLKDTRHHKKNL